MVFPPLRKFVPASILICTAQRGQVFYLGHFPSLPFSVQSAPIALCPTFVTAAAILVQLFVERLLMAPDVPLELLHAVRERPAELARYVTLLEGVATAWALSLEQSRLRSVYLPIRTISRPRHLSLDPIFLLRVEVRFTFLGGHGGQFSLGTIDQSSKISGALLTLVT